MPRPGTVSKILWHFTRGPIWDDTLQKQGSELKPDDKAYDSLTAILSSKELRVGKYKEIVKVVIPKKRRYNATKKDYDEIINYAVTVKSSPVCCVADIPIQHLSYHAKRYGKMAIGFYRDAIVKAGFNPVMYTLEHSSLINSIYSGYSSVDDLDTSDAEYELSSLVDAVKQVYSDADIDDDVDDVSLSSAIDTIQYAQSDLEKFFANMLAYIKTFDTNEFDTIYCEREWRSTKTFTFSADDVAMVILPRKTQRNYFEEHVANTPLPPKVPITCWEDLIEH